MEIHFPVINLMRSDGLPTDRYRVFYINAYNGTYGPLCKCEAAHASDYDAECCQEAEKNIERILNAMGVW